MRDFMADRIKTRAPKLTPLEKRLMLDASLPAIAGQVLWLDGDDASTILDADGDNAATGTGGANNGFGGTVATWRDKSGSGFHVTNTTANQQPTYNATGLNGNGVLTFDGTNDKLRNTTAVVPGNDVTMFIVYNRTTAVARDAVFELGAGGSRNAIFINDSGNRVGYYANSTFYNSSGTYTTSQYEIVSAIHDVNAINMWRNGANQVSTTGLTRASTTGIYVGDDSSGGGDLQGNIAEIIVYDRDLTSDERRDVENYLASKWGLTLASNANPVIAANTGATVSQSDPVIITNAMLNATDADNSEAFLRYTITDLADYGTLTNTNTSHTYLLGEYFTQADIDSGYIVYTHNGTANFTDSFSFTVTDQYATTAAATFNLTITPDNIAPVINGWTLISSEDFQSGATGWNNNTTFAGGGLLTTFLGRYSMDGGVQTLFKTYTLSGTENYTVIEFDMYKLDTWDGETFRVFINDSQVISIPLQQATFNSPANGSSGIVSYTVQEMTPFLANLGSAAGNDQIFRFTLTVQNAGQANVKLGFSSTLNQAVGDESWGVDNVKVYEARNGGTPGPFNIIENSAIGTVVGTVVATDADVAQTITYSVVGGTGASVFSINATTGVITTTAALNYESVSSYTLDIRATDNGSPSYFDMETITITITDMPENTAPTANALGPITIAENTANGTVIGTITGSDPEGDTITWSITAGNTDNIFAINATTGAIRVNSNTNLNYEWDNSYTLTIRAQDNGFGNLTATRNVVINISNINEAPTFNIPQSFLNENPYLRYNAATGNFYQYVGTTANYTAASAAAAASLLNGVAGHLATITSAAENTYVRALGSGNLWLGAADSVVEGEWRWVGGGAEAGQMFWLGAAAGAAQGGYYTNWVAGNPDNSSNEDHLEMQASGLWNDALTSTAKAYVIEWEGAAVMAALGNGPFTMAENPALNQSVGFVHARDSDAGDTIAYSITGGTGASHFAVNAATGEITVTNPSAINFESTTSFTLDIRAQDAGGLSATQTVTINITNVNEAPVLNAGGPFTVTENAANNTLVGTMTASDPDAATTLTYSITSGDTRGVFSINNSGQIRVANTNYLDYELQGTYTLNIRVSDGTLTDNETITINLTNINENPSFDAIQRVLNSDPTLKYSAATGNFYRFVSTTVNYNMAETNAAAALLNGQAGYVAAINSAAESTFIRTIIPTTIWINGTDVAVEGEWRFTSGPNAGELFWLGAAAGSAQNGHYTGWSGGEPNNSGGNEDAIEFRTNGLWNDTNISGTRAYVIEWNGADVLASLQHGPYNVPEHSPVSFNAGTALANDADGGDVISYSITGGTGASLFSISASGVIRLTGAVNYEVQNSYTLDLRVQDAGGLFDTMTITVDITDENDVPSVLNLTGNYIVENSGPGILIGILSTADEDPADTHIYTLLSNPAGKFIIVGNEIRTAADIDFEQNQSFSVMIRVDDGNGGTRDRTFMIQVGDVMDTFTPPPSSGSGGISDPYKPVEEETENGRGNILKAGLGGEEGQSQAFYGMDGQQILRENITFQIRDLLTQLDDEERDLIDQFYVDENGEIIGSVDESTPPAKFTNIREALEFLQQMADADDTEKDADKEAAEEARAGELPPSSIDRQFVDVMTYHQDRAARLREALMG